MTSSYRKFLALTSIGITCFAIAADTGTKITFSGWVIDSACAYTKGVPRRVRRTAHRWSSFATMAPSSSPSTIKRPPLRKTRS